ncbi:DUF4136 domain-containing protein [Paenacidovorax monticola]|uniref:DUF4136 domain-containing protein n=1 Tax=Paenacidovorax monticola TaxID=1926868 RepID=A0A7H0HE41_9BURK|nr:DUF4136 domain-containing protein [Paenacidovorax monticola]QNP58807.1 hypothetical protein H9L24_17955 [Paenacidovorax monticola]
MTSRWLNALFLALAATVLAGCASTRAVDSAVQSYSTLGALPTPPTYRLELLPSQQAQAAQFSSVEAQAQAALQKVGLQRDDKNGRLVVQIGAQARYTSPEYWPYGRGWGPAWGWGVGYGGRWGWGMGGSWMMDRPPTLLYRAVNIVMRDADTQKIVYETSASHEEVWSNDALIFGVLFDAALTGFPHPPSGARQIRTEIPVR